MNVYNVCGGIEVRNGVIAFEVFTSNLGQCSVSLCGLSREGCSKTLIHTTSCMARFSND